MLQTLVNSKIDYNNYNNVVIGRVPVLRRRVHPADLPRLPLSVVGPLYRAAVGALVHDLRPGLYDLRCLAPRRNYYGGNLLLFFVMKIER